MIDFCMVVSRRSVFRRVAALKVADVSPLSTGGAMLPFERAITSVLVVVAFGVVVDAGKNIRHIEHALAAKIKQDPPTRVLLKVDDIDADLAVVTRFGHKRPKPATSTALKKSCRHAG